MQTNFENTQVQNTQTQPLSLLAHLPYVLAGIGFGFLLIKSEAASWYRIQEMFRFQSFHMFGIIGSAVLVGFISTRLLLRSGVRALDGSRIEITQKEPGMLRYVFGGLLFGLGWGLVGSCPGPIFALIGAGIPSMLIVFVAALLGVWAYGNLRQYLPH